MYIQNVTNTKELPLRLVIISASICQNDYYGIKSKLVINFMLEVYVNSG